MRKLKLQMQVSLDGFVATEDGDIAGWANMDWSEDLKEYIRTITQPVDTILLGRKLAESFIPAWEQMLTEKVEGADKMVNTPKIVFSKTITTQPWKNTVVNNGHLAEEINKLKNQPGGDIIAYGGAGFVMNLIAHNLVDEFHLLVEPVALSKGMPIFGNKTFLQLISTAACSCGTTIMFYKSSHTQHQ